MTTPADTPMHTGHDHSPGHPSEVPHSTKPSPDLGQPTLPTVEAPPFREAVGAPELPGYDILRELGRGGMGVVYQARERKGNRMVALKTMQGLDAHSLLRFKQEYRSLAGLSHPNLVSLYELTGSGALWYFTMELIDGLHFLQYIHANTEERANVPTLLDAPVSGTLPTGNSALLSARQQARLRDALAQLAAGVHFLHESGKLHRDLKPGNVLVTPQGRVVLLDFGLATELDRHQLHYSSHLIGTVAYMAPEQAARQPVSPASDWYSVGVMLYEALTGTLPFSGESYEVLHNKQQLDPFPPSTVQPGTPEDLSTLCMELLRRQPDLRPSGAEVLRRLSERMPPTGSATPLPAAPRLEVPLIGREKHLQILGEAFEQMREGETVLVDVQGRSGAGKSALMQRFLADVEERQETVILAGRCYEQESVPYKALDSLIDALSRYLERLPAGEAQAILPRDLTTLARVFPVLRRLDSAAASARRVLVPSDPHEVRRRALTALRELMGRLGDRRPLILAIDDLQWGDEDSSALLVDLLRPPDPPALLLLLSYRSEEMESSPCLRTLLAAKDLATLPRRELAVEPLTPDERRALALALLDPRDDKAAARADAIAKQSGGYPYFVHELAQYVQSGATTSDRPSSVGDITLNTVLWERILRLPEEARRLLAVVAVAGRPLPQADACRAADIHEEHSALACLRSGRLLRSSGSGEDINIETYHDRIRETVLLHLDPGELEHQHRRLAEVLEASDRADAEDLAVHLAGAGESERAGHYYALAAARAAETLAFDRAAKLYQLALELQTPWGDQERQLRTKLGDALANAGRGAESARAYLTAAADSDSGEKLELQRRAALQFLRSGHIDDGLDALRTVLSSVGLRLLTTPRRAFWALVGQRVRLFFRGLRYRLRSVEQINAAELTRLDICQSASIGLSMVDTLQGAYFQTRSLLLALRAGEAERLVPALAMEAAHISVGGRKARARTEHFLQSAEALAQQSDRPYAHAMVALARGIAAALAGEWRNGQRLCDEAEGIFRDSCTGAVWERGTTHRFALWPLMYMGDIREINRRLPRLLQEARERDDLYEETNLCLVIRTFARLAADEPERARIELAEVMGKWSQHGFHVQHMNRLFDEGQIDLYQGDVERAWQRQTEWMARCSGTFWQRIQQIRILTLDQRARSALALAGGSDTTNWLRIAERDARSLRREKVPWSDALAHLLEAAIAFHRGDAERSRHLLTAAVEGFTATEMHLHAAAARRRLGQLTAGERGLELIRQAEEWMNGQTIRNLERMTALLTPGWPNTRGG